MVFPIEKIFIQESACNDRVTRRILEKTAAIPHEVIRNGHLGECVGSVSQTQGKKILWITRSSGDMVKPCPGTLPPYLCCRYTVINQAIQCPMDCTYCVLQTYLNSPWLTVYTNLEDLFVSIDRLLKRYPDRFFRFGTGELTDSLALDEWTGVSAELIEFFSGKKNCFLELKTKTAQVDNLMTGLTKNTVVSWSVNPQPLVHAEEYFSADMEERIRAAAACQDRGFLLGFHFDPILYVPDWESLYYELVQKIFSQIDGSRVAWVSLGSLRFPPQLKEVVRQRFPGTRIVYQEMVSGMDGKLRYPKPRRMELYQKIHDWIKERAPDLFVYLCMEPPRVWERVVGAFPRSNGELDFWFARSIWERFSKVDMKEPVLETYLKQSD